jgi:hypothetical protein
LFDGFMSAMWGGVCLIWLKSAVSFHALLVFSQFLSVVFPFFLLLRICSSIGEREREDKHALQRVVREFVGSVFVVLSVFAFPFLVAFRSVSFSFLLSLLSWIVLCAYIVP